MQESGLIPGGKSESMSVIDIAKKYAGNYYDYRNVLELVKAQIKKGIKVEKEHTANSKIAAEIAKDHVAEDLRYYDKLKKIEKEGLESPKDNPCWRGYHPVGTKTKDGKEVPNCVPVNEAEGTCCGKCGHVHAKGTSCPKPFLTGKHHCSRRTNEVHTADQTIECEKCGWKWNLADGGEDPYVCHECGFDNTDEYKNVNVELETEDYCPHCLAEYITECWNSGTIEEAEYRGRKVTLGKPFLTPGGPKKRSVYVKNAKGNVVKVNFGDPNMRIKKSNPKRRKSYRARHHCQTPGPRWKANYWSCRAW